jgi:hypothetical protein
VFDKLTHLLSIFDWKIKEVEIRDFNPNCVIDEFILDYYNLLPIPLSELSLNPKLVQNPKW